MFLPTFSLPSSPGGRRRLVAAGLAVVLAGLSGCATKGDLRDVETRIQTLTNQQQAVLQELQRQNRVTVDTLRSQSDQLVDLRGNVSQSLRQILSELQTLRELAGQNQRTIASVRDQLVALQRSVRTGVPAASGPVGEERPADESPDVMYRDAMEVFNRGSLRAAELGFQQFIRAYPRHELTPLAHYNLADTYVQDGRFQEAIEEFSKIPERFPNHDRVPRAEYRIGLIHINDLDQPEEGRRILQRLINTFPDSPAAELAQETLEELGGGDDP